MTTRHRTNFAKK